VPYGTGGAAGGVLDVSDGIFKILSEMGSKPASRDVLVYKSYERDTMDMIVDRTVYSDMWKVVL
jgi:hypothetical protein